MANKAIDLFAEIKENSDDIIILLVLNACAQMKTKESLNLIKRIFEENSKLFHDNDHLLTSLVDALVKCGDLSGANIIFSKMKRNVISYSILMNGYLEEKNPKKVFDLYNQMKNEQLIPDSIVYLHLIKASSQIANYSLCQSIVKNIPKFVFGETQIHNALVDMWVSRIKYRSYLLSPTIIVF